MPICVYTYTNVCVNDRSRYKYRAERTEGGERGCERRGGKRTASDWTKARSLQDLQRQDPRTVDFGILTSLNSTESYAVSRVKLTQDNAALHWTVLSVDFENCATLVPFTWACSLALS